MSELVAIDWGTTSFRAYSIGKNGKIIKGISSERGIRFIQNGQFEETLVSELERLGQVTADTPVIASGMITSRQGWCETPYVQCPAGIQDLAVKLVALKTERLGTLWFVPGVKQLYPEPDIMRGEETQVAGIDAGEAFLAVLPGTHSKWVEIRDRSIIRFRTFMTGELYGLLLKYSILAATFEDEWSEDAFIAGVRRGGKMAAQNTGLLAELFQFRARSILGMPLFKGGASQLSGLLIGYEIADALRYGFDRGEKILVIGAERVAWRYRLALGVMGLDVETVQSDAAAQGLYRLAQHGKLI